MKMNTDAMYIILYIYAKYTILILYIIFNGGSLASRVKSPDHCQINCLSPYMYNIYIYICKCM